MPVASVARSRNRRSNDRSSRRSSRSGTSEASRCLAATSTSTGVPPSVASSRYETASSANPGRSSTAVGIRSRQRTALSTCLRETSPRASSTPNGCNGAPGAVARAAATSCRACRAVTRHAVRRNPSGVVATGEASATPRVSTSRTSLRCVSSSAALTPARSPTAASTSRSVLCHTTSSPSWARRCATAARTPSTADSRGVLGLSAPSSPTAPASQVMSAVYRTGVRETSPDQQFCGHDGSQRRQARRRRDV